MAKQSIKRQFEGLMEIKTSWFVYMLKCGDGSFYTGLTSDLKKRVHRHKMGRGVDHTKHRLPVELVYACEVATRRIDS